MNVILLASVKNSRKKGEEMGLESIFIFEAMGVEEEAEEE